MKPPKNKSFYRQRLPHIQPLGTTFFVTFRLYGSIPKVKLTQLKNIHTKKINSLNKQLNTIEKNSQILKIRKLYFAKYDQLLDTIRQGPIHLANPIILNIIKEQLHRFDGELYDLIAYTIMSNHVHVLFDTSIQFNEDNSNLTIKSLDRIMKRIKGASASYANRALKIKGQFWDRESYDMYIRNEKMLHRVIRYILNNPVKAKMVKNPCDFEGNYLKETYGDMARYSL